MIWKYSHKISIAKEKVIKQIKIPHNPECGQYPINILSKIMDFAYSEIDYNLMLVGSCAHQIISSEYFKITQENKKINDIDYIIFSKRKSLLRDFISMYAAYSPTLKLDGNLILFDCLNYYLIFKNNKVVFKSNTSFRDCAIDIKNWICLFGENYKKTIENNVLYPPSWWESGNVPEIIGDSIEDVTRAITIVRKNKIQCSKDFSTYLNELLDHSLDTYGDLYFEYIKNIFEIVGKEKKVNYTEFQETTIKSYKYVIELIHGLSKEWNNLVNAMEKADPKNFDAERFAELRIKFLKLQKSNCFNV